MARNPSTLLANQNHLTTSTTLQPTIFTTVALNPTNTVYDRAGEVVMVYQAVLKSD